MAKKGKRQVCAKCGIPYYDLGNENHPCPVCAGTTKNRWAKYTTKKKSTTKQISKNGKTKTKSEEPPKPSTKLSLIYLDGEEMTCFPSSLREPITSLAHNGWYVASTEKPSAEPPLDVADFLYLNSFPNKGLFDYICGADFRGIGPSIARQLIGEDGQNLLENLASIERLKQSYPLVNEALLKQLNNAWLANEPQNNLKILLFELGFSSAQQIQILETYGSSLPRVINERVFSLVKNISRFTFEDALSLCSRLNLAISEENKIIAGTEYFLSKTERDRQHTCAPSDIVNSKVSELISVHSTRVAEVLDEQRQLFHFAQRRNKEVISTLESRDRDKNVAVQFARLQSKAATLSSKDLAGAEFAIGDEVTLSREQIEAITSAASSPISIITGGPGAGKTTMVRGLVEALKANGKKIKLCAPTGRAAKRIAETPGLSSFRPSTIHMFLRRQERKQEEFDYMIVDESSMIDIELMLELLAAIPDGANIIFIGDADQLPPVGPGQPFKDLIEAEKFPIARLTGNFRQDTFSETVKAARSIIEGKSPKRNDEFLESDFVFFDVPQAQQAEKILQLYFDSVPNKLGVEAVDIQILSPQRPGHVGMNKLNRLIQDQTTKSSKPVLTKKSGNEDVQIFLGDKVIYRKNNYQLGVMNGDIGRVLRLSGKELIVEFEGEAGAKEIALEGKDKFEMDLAYATTIHSSQGSEYPGVIVPVTSAHHYMLSRNLLYTAITRGKRQVCLVGEWDAFEKAISMFAKDFRYTLLSETLN